MNVLVMLLSYLDNILMYLLEMIPCMVAGVLIFFLLRPVRRRRLARRGLVSGPWREGGLLLFVMFLAGLAALTLFPANLWRYVLGVMLDPSAWGQELELFRFYPTREQTLRELANLPNMLAPFREIKRAARSSWVLFILIANIGIFAPVGFFLGLLWRKLRWWMAVLAGVLLSCFIEVFQVFIGRISDIDDVILNSAGVLLGFWIFAAFQWLFPRAAAKFHCRATDDTKESHHA